MKRKKIVNCYNCSSELPLTLSLIQTKDFEQEETIRATYVECTVCGEKMLKQLDTIQTYEELAPKIVKLTLLQQKHKLSPKQKSRLLKLERQLKDIRESLNNKYFNEIYQSLNQEKTGTANQEA